MNCLSLPQVHCFVSTPFSLSANRTPVYFETGWAYKVLTKTNFMCLGLVYPHKKRKFTKGHFKGQERPYFYFWTQRVHIRSIFMTIRVGIIGIESTPGFRYGFSLYPPFKKTACFFWILCTILGFLPKIWLSKWSWFLKVGLRGVKSKK